ncbi:unnamed protein product [Closterium sp. Naga37s-1]|nr:unnamed protein product [Closterium sp. Naga37s-1]
MCLRLRSRFNRNYLAVLGNAQADNVSLPDLNSDGEEVNDVDDAPHAEQTGDAPTEPSIEDEPQTDIDNEGGGDPAEEECDTVGTSGDADNVDGTVDNFDTLLEVYRFIVGCNNGAGLSNESTVWLLNLLRQERLNLSLLHAWRSLYAVTQYGLSLMMQRREYTCKTFQVPGCPITFEVMCANGKEVVLELFGHPDNAEGFVLYPEQHISGAGRIYTTPHTATYWENAQVVVTEQYGEGTVVVPLIISSDATILSGNEHAKRLGGNRPEWHRTIHRANPVLGAEINRRAIVGVLQWHESCIRGGSHSDDSLDEFAEATRRMVQTMEAVFPRGGEGYNLVKVHLMTHLPEAVRRGGMPREFSAAVYENAHIRTCKQPYRASNRRQVEQAIADHNTTAAVLARLPGSLPPRNTNQIAIMKAIATGSPQLTRASRCFTQEFVGAASSIFAEYNEALEGGLVFYEDVMRAANLVPFPPQVHNGVALPRAPTDEGHIKPRYARAAVELHGQPAFSCVEYERDDGAAAFGKLCLLLTAQRSGADGESGPAEVAVLTSFLEVGHDDCTGCTMLSPVTIWRGLVVVPLHRLVRAVHCVPSFENPDLWFLNKWAFRCLEDIH